MDLVQALHSAARRYCIERASHWHEQYRQLSLDGLDRITAPDYSWTYTPEAQGIFPRYNVLATIQRSIETVIPADFDSLAQAREFLASAVASADDDSTRTTNPIESAAITAEREHFARYLGDLSEAALATVSPLPYRKVLPADASRQFYSQFVNVWGHWHGGGVDRVDLPPHLTLHTAFANDEEIADTLRDIFRTRGVARLIEFREYDGDYELDVDLASFLYNGAEGWWTSPTDFSWMVYASHESSLTFGGQWLIDAVRRAWPHCEPYRYKGWDLSTYNMPS